VSRIPPGLARRVDRLAWRAHAFHRWAHHPLCSWYAAEVVLLGRRARLCLGCTLTAAGAGTGIALGLLAPAAPGPASLAAGLLLLAAVPLVVRPALAPRGRAGARARKLLTRFLPAAAAGLLVAQAAGAPSAMRVSAAALAAAGVGWVTARYRHRGPDRASCRACPQGPPGARCPGLAPIARRERALSRLAGRWIAAALPVPVPAAATAPGPGSPPAPAGPAASPPGRARP